MKTRTMLLTAVLTVISGIAAEWQPVPGNLMTRWAKEVSPAKVLPEYPRPQMVRQDWQNLNGLWDYAIADRESARPETFAGEILVPFPVESALSGVKQAVTEKQHLWYHRTFTIPAGWKGKNVLLHFGAVDWEAVVTVNGQAIGSHQGGYDPFTFDITAALKEGVNDLVVRVWDPTNAGPYPKGKQNSRAIKNPGGIMYTPVSGIWQTVWLEPVAKSAIQSLQIVPDLEASSVRIKVIGEGPVAVVVLDGQKEIANGTGTAGNEIAIKIPEPKLWTPETPHLYDLRIKLGDADDVKSYFAMRKISLAKDDQGIVRMMLNGKFVFQAGFLDQGFWPDGIYVAPTDEALKWDIEISKKLGMNMARKHVKIEPDRWYYWCDKLGLLVWQDMPSGTQGDQKTEKGKAATVQFEKELKAMIDARSNHPCIVMWVVFNEGWGQYDTPRLTQWVKDYDPTRLVSNASGWTDQNCGDINDMHNYPGPGCPKLEDKRAAVLGEFGGLGLPTPGHMWVDKNWGYRQMTDQKKLTSQYVKLMRGVYALKDKGLNACVYTQTTDCETEANGLITYDREVIKPDLETIANANRGIFEPAPELKVVVPTSQEKAQTWFFTTEKPADDWFKPQANTATWKEAPGGFGTKGTPGSMVRTEWKTPDIWIRRTFDLPEGKLVDPVLILHHDEGADVYINGVLAVKTPGHISDYEQFDLSPEAKATLKPGANTIAIHCHQTAGGQYIDAGIADQIPAKK